MMLRDKNNLSHTALFVLLAYLLIFAPLSLAAEPIGLVKTYQPHSTAMRLGAEIKLELGTEIFQGDTIITDSDSVVGIIFTDGAVLTIGPSSQLTIEDFLFIPAEEKVSFLTYILKGSIAFISGAIGRISPESVQFKTPTATVGLRGTKVLIEVE